MKRKIEITEKEQRIAVDILEHLIFSNTRLPKEFFDKMMERYELRQDPFSGLPCTTEEYVKNHIEYDRQCMFEKYGHCDGMD